MPGRKRRATGATTTQTNHAVTDERASADSSSATALAEPETSQSAASPMERPEWIDGPPTNAAGEVMREDAEPVKNWGEPYKVIFTCKAKGFELGENRRFKQRTFMFVEKPAEDVLAALKENGFTYRAGEKSWTIQADATTRALSDDLARAFAGESASLSR